ncbi:unnamed protein product [Rangifer tarandus platyrhynchus]|uniref:Uncharacterized protein n=1 Tax=Rangifer tarandus platyrhynchus TaxID=3082113 RepID=A0ABN8ZQE7_RANTA|nr:unnamed protein product [Rangifer tarandus platyrhynchus]
MCSGPRAHRGQGAFRARHSVLSPRASSAPHVGRRPPRESSLGPGGDTEELRQVGPTSGQGNEIPHAVEHRRPHAAATDVCVHWTPAPQPECSPPRKALRNTREILPAQRGPDTAKRANA